MDLLWASVEKVGSSAEDVRAGEGSEANGAFAITKTKKPYLNKCMVSTYHHVENNKSKCAVDDTR